MDFLFFLDLIDPFFLDYLFFAPIFFSI